MGVKVKDIISPEKISFRDLDGKIIAIDAANTIYQFLSSIRQTDGTPLMDSSGNVTSHLSGLLYRISSIVEKGIKPIFIFDGKPSPLKSETLNKRNEIKEKSEKQWKIALKEGDEESARKFATRTSRMSTYIIETSKTLLNLMGIPYVEAFGEGEAQATYMVQNGDAWAVASQDYDCLLFGAPRILRNLTLSGNKNDLEYYKLENVLNNLKISREQLIDLSLMVGTDFNPGIRGIGAKTALKIIRSKTLEEYLIEKNETLGRHPYELRDLFLNHEINKDYNIKWEKVNKEKLIGFMCDEHGFSKERVLTAEKKMEKINSPQNSLDAWF
ncbi:flap endonuclease-1 [Methanobrevibacter curvatus]|uniref:Flap endonuclease 1 n=1 Tax=Methanobrevibacter curvatus TaxID=49547 RepID=A0A166CEY9_9EURY|nr:flap endonuclease-1 [Methanobrevibacter curvatus]KZX14430.1 DNA polymerase I [Methanobrevibacter curvatus]